MSKKKGGGIMADITDKNSWHPAFVAAMELDLREYRDVLSFDPDYPLSKEPLKMDLLIIKKKKDVVIKNDIGAIFRGHNIIEYKSPDAELSIDNYSKTLGYAYLYKGLGAKVNEIPLEELTVTMIRDRLPLELFKKIKELGGKIEEKFPGVYYITGLTSIPCQFVLTKSLELNDHAMLKVLSKTLAKDVTQRFLTLAPKYTEPGDRNNIAAILTVSYSANKEMFESVWRELNGMRDGYNTWFKAFFGEEIEKEKEEAVSAAVTKTKDASLVTTIKNLVKNLGIDATKAMDSMGIPAAEQARYAAML